jgi:Raf kinase inhibitor-like YbhB/YbcL family protein
VTHPKIVSILAGVLVCTLIALGCSSDGEDETDAVAPAAASDSAGPAAEPGEYKLQQTFPLDIELTSTVFNRIRRIPIEYTCTDNEYYPTTGADIRYGQDKSPPLAWTGASAETVSFAIVVDDPDVAVDEERDPSEEVVPFVHWVIWNIPATVTELDERVPTTTEVAAIGPDIRQGTNDFGGVGYGGPCPPPNLTAIFGSQSGNYDGEGGGLRKQSPHGYMFRVYALDAELDLPAGATKNELLKAMEGHVLSTGELKGEYVNKRIFK